jgi:hypothetical protein
LNRGDCLLFAPYTTVMTMMSIVTMNLIIQIDDMSLTPAAAAESSAGAEAIPEPVLDPEGLPAGSDPQRAGRAAYLAQKVSEGATRHPCARVGVASPLSVAITSTRAPDHHLVWRHQMTCERRHHQCHPALPAGGSVGSRIRAAVWRCWGEGKTRVPCISAWSPSGVSPRRRGA